MPQEFKILYHPDVSHRDLPKISKYICKILRKAIETKLMRAPTEFGTQLRKTLRGYWKLRVGDFRVIYKISGHTVLILRIGHRREVYLHS